MDRAARSQAPITRDDLARLGQLARLDREDFFARFPQRRVLADRVIAVALCQGAALHYLDGRNGVKDFDVWTFYAAHPDAAFPQRRRVVRDLGYSKFGQSSDFPDLVGRHVDLLGRSLQVAAVDADPMIALRTYLREARTNSAHFLAQKAVVLIEPVELAGAVAWPVRDPLPSDNVQ